MGKIAEKIENARVNFHWFLQEKADEFWDKGWLIRGNLCCRFAGFIFPQKQKKDPSKWNGHHND